MGRRFTLKSETARQGALAAVRDAPEGMEVIVKEPTRSLDANAAMWAMLHDISTQVEWYGQKLTQDEWKCMFSASLKKQKTLPGLDGGFVVVGAYTSKMTKAEFSDLLELMSAFGSERGVKWSEKEAV